jgi:ribosomal protein S12 methylthiotransferase accessory factor
VRAQVTWADGQVTEGWGKAPFQALAADKAIGEACERHAFTTLTDGVHLARAEELPEHIEPGVLTGVPPDRYLQPGFPCQPWAAAASKHWIQVQAVRGGELSWVLADCVFHASAFPDQVRAGLVYRANSSGCAAGRSPQDALCRSLLELLERDAFMRHWFAQQPGHELALRVLPDAVSSRLKHLRRVGVHANLQVLHLGLAPVVLACVQDDKRRFTCVGTACGWTLAGAIDAALNEAELSAQVRWHGVPATSVAPNLVRTPADHAALYAQPDHYRMADRVLCPDTEATAADTDLDSPWADGLDGLCAYLSDRDLNVWALDISPAGSPCHVVRAFVPGLIPIAFGHHLQPDQFDQWQVVDRPVIHPLA